MTQQHAKDEVVKLRAVRDGDGGQVAVVVAEPGPGAAFYTGLQRPPAATGLEVVLTFLADQHNQPYRRIVVFTGRNRDRPGPHLPPLLAGSGLKIGREPGVWEYRSLPKSGTEERSVQPQPSGAAQYASRLGEVVRREQRKYREETSHAEILVTFQSEMIWDQQVEKVLALIETATGQVWNGYRHKAGTPPTDRTLLILDESLLLPIPEQFPSLLGLGAGKKDALRDRLHALPRLIEKTPIDLVFLCQMKDAIAAIQEGRMLRDQLVRLLYADHPADSPQTVGLPSIHWGSETSNLTCISLRRLDSETPFDAFLPMDTKHRNLYDVLRNVPPRPPGRGPILPAADPGEIELGFWAEIDVEGLDEHLRSQVIGQRHVIATIVQSLRDFRETCQDALANGRTTLTATATFGLPVFLLMGEAGMGKTFVASTIADFLFGPRYYKYIELNNASMTDVLIGVRNGFVGSPDPTPFQAHMQESGGLGLVLFDELDKVLRENSNGPLDRSISTVLTAIQFRQLRPNNSNHANSPGGLLKFANTIFMFTANVLAEGQVYRPGYERLSALGDPFLSRIPSRNRLSFGVIESEDVRLAIEFSLKSYVKTLMKDIFREGTVELESQLIDQLALEFDQITAGRTEIRNYRALQNDFLGALLPQAHLKAKFRTGQLRVDRNDLQGHWQPEARP